MFQGGAVSGSASCIWSVSLSVLLPQKRFYALEMLLEAETAAEALGGRTKKKKKRWNIRVESGGSGWVCGNSQAECVWGGCTCSLCGRQQRLCWLHTLLTLQEQDSIKRRPGLHHACMHGLLKRDEYLNFNATEVDIRRKKSLCHLPRGGATSWDVPSLQMPQITQLS